MGTQSDADPHNALTRTSHHTVSTHPCMSPCMDDPAAAQCCEHPPPTPALMRHTNHKHHTQHTRPQSAAHQPAQHSTQAPAHPPA